MKGLFVLARYKADPYDSYFFGDFPQWGAWVVVLCWLVSFVLKRAEQDDLSRLFFAASIWLPLALINLDRPIVLVLVTGLAIYFCKDSLRGFFQNNPRQGTTEKEVDGSGVETHTEYYENGQKSSEKNFKNGKQNGLENQWHENGNKAYETTFIDGKREGFTVRWYENGRKEYEYNLKNDELDGLETGWYENGKKEWVANYKDGEKNGLWIKWYENGQKKSEENFKDGEPDGLFIDYNEDGTEQGRSTFKDGELVD